MSQDVVIVEGCEVCMNWGPTKIVGVSCPKCKRCTYPNLGVNWPAGDAWGACGLLTQMYDTIPEQQIKQGRKLIDKIVEDLRDEQWRRSDEKFKNAGTWRHSW